MTHAFPPDRRGKPDPLPFHLGYAAAGYHQAVMAAPAAQEPGFPWHPALGAPNSTPNQIAVAEAALARLRAMTEGLKQWQNHRYSRKMAEMPVIWQAGSTKLRDYAPGSTGQPVMVIPSLINRPYILDLDPDRSMLRAMAQAELRPVLVDWGAPGFDESKFDLDAYVTARLFPAAAFLSGQAGRPAALLGYCMGGALAAALAARMPVPAMVTIGAPWSFDDSTGLAAEIRGMLRQIGAAKLRNQLDSMISAFGVVPDLLIQHLFAQIKPFDAARKFRRFAALEPDSAAARRFVALEDWLADGVSMAGPAACDLLIDWHLANTLPRGGWQVMGRPVLADDIRCPTLVIAGQRDTIAPSGMATPLAEAIPGARLQTPDLGHVGMIIGRKAPELVWSEVIDFLRQFDKA